MSTYVDTNIGRANAQYDWQTFNNAEYVRDEDKWTNRPRAYKRAYAEHYAGLMADYWCTR